MKLRTILPTLAITLLFSTQAHATANLANMEAMFIYNFLRHVNWPEASNQGDFVIGVYGNSDIFPQLLSYTSNRTVGTRKIVIQRIKSSTEAAQCQVVFVPSYNSGKIGQLKADLGNRSTLIVGEREGATDSGATIEFVFKDDKLKFKINEECARQQNLGISRSLLDMSV